MNPSRMKYFLCSDLAEEREVTREEFAAAERRAGFRPKTGFDLATGGFSKTEGRKTVSGRIISEPVK